MVSVNFISKISVSACKSTVNGICYFSRIRPQLLWKLQHWKENVRNWMQTDCAGPCFLIQTQSTACLKVLSQTLVSSSLQTQELRKSSEIQLFADLCSLFLADKACLEKHEDACETLIQFHSNHQAFTWSRWLQEFPRSTAASSAPRAAPWTWRRGAAHNGRLDQTERGGTQGQREPLGLRAGRSETPQVTKCHQSEPMLAIDS